MMKIDYDEWYPVFYTQADEEYGGVSIEWPNKLDHEDYRKTVDRFNYWQCRLEELYDEAKRKELLGSIPPIKSEDVNRAWPK